MGDIIKSPLLTLIAVVVLWAILYNLFVRVLTEVQWKKLDYVWITIGLTGLIGLVFKNKQEFTEYELRQKKQLIEFRYENIVHSLRGSQACFKYIRGEWSPEDFDLRQADQDSVCKWSKKLLDTLDLSLNNNFRLISTSEISDIALHTDFVKDFVEEKLKEIQDLNTSIGEFHSLEAELKANWWDDAQRTIGVLLLIVAFAVRLSITTYNVQKLNRKT